MEEVEDAERPLRRLAEVRSQGKYNFTEEEAVQWWPADWEERWACAAPLRPRSVPPPGLQLAQVDVDLAEQALTEVLPHFHADAGEGQRSAVEVGWTMDFKASSDGFWVAKEAHPLGAFTHLTRLVETSTRMLLGEAAMVKTGWDRMNISCLRYLHGQGIEFHKDRPTAYAEEVFGCVLMNTSDRALEFLNGQERFVLEESAGSCFLQRGKARYHWRHGVRPVGEGQRISVTWRWFLPDVRMQSRGA